MKENTRLYQLKKGDVQREWKNGHVIGLHDVIT